MNIISQKKQILKDLKNKINNFYNDRNINGKFSNIQIKNNNLIIFWEEEKETYSLEISNFENSSINELYSIWFETWLDTHDNNY